MLQFEHLKEVDEEIYDNVVKEYERQQNGLEFIASENRPSEAVLEAQASYHTLKYAEGYPSNRYSGREGRYYGGTQNVDKLEEYCCDKWREVFKTNYHVNVQPHSGSQANLAAYMSVLTPGDKILSMELESGGCGKMASLIW